MRRSERGKRGKKEDAAAQKGSKVAMHCDFPMICGCGGSKSIAKAAGAGPSSQITPLWHEERLEVKVRKTKEVRRTFGS